MKELTLETLLAVFEEVFGRGLFWSLVVVAVAVLAAFAYVALRDRGLDSRNFLRAELAAPLGAILAILFVQWVTSSSFSDVGGPIDVIVLILIGTAGAIGIVFLSYLAMALLRRGAGRAASAAPARAREGEA